MRKRRGIMEVPHMYAFRYNPLTKTWVVLGGTTPAPLALTEAHFFDIGKQHSFVAAAYPHDQFVMEPPKKLHPDDQHLLFGEQAAVGEHELFLYSGWTELYEWDQEDWEGWIELAQQRLQQVHQNPYLHYVHLSLPTHLRGTVANYQRVGDLLATSHPVVGQPLLLETELADKLITKEDLFVVRSSRYGHLFVPSAPSQEKELWYIPKQYRPGFEEIEAEERRDLASVLTDVLPALHREFSDVEFNLVIHSAVAGKSADTTWWLQLYQPSHSEDLFITRPYPESFAQRLHYILAPPR